MSAGAVLSLISWVVALGVVYPTGTKIVAITREMVKNRAPQDPRLHNLALRLKISSGVGLVLLIAILICMGGRCLTAFRAIVPRCIGGEAHVVSSVRIV